MDCTTYRQLVLERETVKENIENRITSRLGKEDAQNNSPLDQTPLYKVISRTGDESGDFIFQLKE
ncbi:MAG: hypothetical protein ACLFST_05330 [Spirochaetia bacterium]